MTSLVHKMTFYVQKVITDLRQIYLKFKQTNGLGSFIWQCRLLASFSIILQWRHIWSKWDHYLYLYAYWINQSRLNHHTFKTYSRANLSKFYFLFYIITSHTFLSHEKMHLQIQEFHWTHVRLHFWLYKSFDIESKSFCSPCTFCCIRDVLAFFLTNKLCWTFKSYLTTCNKKKINL